MNRTVAAILLSAFLATSQARCDSLLENFITRDGDKLMDGPSEFRFVSFNTPCLHYLEDNFPFDDPNPWRRPDEFELTDSLETVRLVGGRAVRIYCLSVKAPGEDPAIPRHVLGPGKFNEEAFRVLDKMLQVANKIGVRVIIPFMDNHHWWGGRAEYAAFSGKGANDFWTDPQLIADFEKTIEYVINRTNYYTGVKYKDDKAILAWETGNELQCPPTWTKEIAAYVKSLDHNHLLMDGFNTNLLKPEQLNEENVDILCTHEYPDEPVKMFERVLQSRRMAKGKKVYIVGEFGFMTTQAVADFLDIVIQNDISGALLWGMRFHNRDGGFYWHSEPWGSDVYKAYHWPGFESGQRYDEKRILDLMRRKAYEIQGMTAPPIEPPKPPRLLPIADVAAISWQGAAGAAAYDVERAPAKDGPWTVVGRDVSDAAVQYRPLFNDTGVDIGRSCFYRVTAKNAAGCSQPSNIVGPVEVTRLNLIDEMQDLHKMYAFTGKVKIVSSDARKCKEDIHRLPREKGVRLIYKVSGPIESFKVYAFFDGKAEHPALAVSEDGKDFTKLTPKISDCSGGQNYYGYLTPILYEADARERKARYLAIGFTGDAQIGRVEIYYGK
jgi:mannan endo-1,4-beta-mannosidase